MKRAMAMVIAGVAMFGAPAYSQTEHHHGGRHGAAESMSTAKAEGQDTFAAIAEIVAILEADPETDWSRVDIGALHRHLLDMDALFTGTRVTEELVVNGLRMTVAGHGAGGEAARRMVPAHAPFLEAQTGWGSTVDVGDDAIIWTIAAASELEAAKIRNLGFYGLMATGAHHWRHHIDIARGRAMR